MLQAIFVLVLWLPARRSWADQYELCCNHRHYCNDFRPKGCCDMYVVHTYLIVRQVAARMQRRMMAVVVPHVYFVKPQKVLVSLIFVLHDYTELIFQIQRYHPYPSLKLSWAPSSPVLRARCRAY